VIYQYLDTNRLNEKIEIFEEIFSHLHEIYKTIDFDEFQRIIIRQIMDLTDCERALLFLVNRETNELISKDAFDINAKKMIMPIDNNSIAGYCAQTGLIVNLENVQDFEKICNCSFKFNPKYDILYGFQTKNVLSVPIFFDGEVVAVLQALSKKEGSFIKRDEILLEKYGHLIAGIIVWRQQIEDLRTLETLEREKAQFIRLLVHELKSPVSAVVGLLNMVLDDTAALPEEQKKSFLLRAKDRGEELLKTINDLLILHNLQSDTVMKKFEILDTAEIVEHLLEEYKDTASSKNIEIFYKRKGNEFRVRGSKTFLPLIFSNLISNAIKYSFEGGKIEIQLTGKRKFVYFTIRDYGMGIPEKDQKRLFREFMRGSNVKKKRISGTGLGLVAVKNIVDMHHGKIFFKSRENEGSWFMVRLPIASEFIVLY
jgi:signal transduction histidine kinase